MEKSLRFRVIVMFIFMLGMAMSVDDMVWAKEYKDNGYVYVVENKKVTLEKYVGDKKVKKLWVPASLRGYPVTTIEGECFKRCRNVKSIIIPSSITDIGSFSYENNPNEGWPDDFETNPFYGCVSLQECIVESGNKNYVSVEGVLYNKKMNVLLLIPADYQKKYTMPKSVRTLATFALADQKNIKKIVLPKGMKTINRYAFYGAQSIKKVVFPSTVRKIGQYSFCKTGLTTLTLPEGVERVYEGAFDDCSRLTRVKIPKSLTYFGYYEDCGGPDPGHFQNCNSLRKITVASGNKKFFSKNGVLFQRVNWKKENIQAVLLRYPAAKKSKTYTVKENIHIKDYAFYGCTRLTSVTILGDMWYPYDAEFYKCEGIQVYMKKQAKGKVIFEKCRNCKLIREG